MPSACDDYPEHKRRVERKGNRSRISRSGGLRNVGDGLIQEFKSAALLIDLFSAYIHASLTNPFIVIQILLLDGLRGMLKSYCAFL